MPLDGTLYEDKVLKVLRGAHDLLSDKDNWCKCVLTRDGQYCARGAVMLCAGASHVGRVYGDFGKDGSGELFSKANGYMKRAALEKGKGVTQVNDLLGHSATLIMFRRAIELRQQEIMEAVGGSFIFIRREA